MDVIDGSWLKARLPKDHGSKKAFAEAVGLSTDKLSKVLNNSRKLTPQEIANTLAYFEELPNAHLGERSPPKGLAEEAAPYIADDADEAAKIASLFRHCASNPAVTHRASVALPDLGIWPGDLLICDLARLPRPGEIAIVSLQTETGEADGTLVRRYLPPFLVSGSCALAHAPLTETPDTVTARHPVIGILRRPEN